MRSGRSNQIGVYPRAPLSSEVGPLNHSETRRSRGRSSVSSSVTVIAFRILWLCRMTRKAWDVAGMDLQLLLLFP